MIVHVDYATFCPTNSVVRLMEKSSQTTNLFEPLSIFTKTENDTPLTITKTSEERNTLKRPSKRLNAKSRKDQNLKLFKIAAILMLKDNPKRHKNLYDGTVKTSMDERSQRSILNPYWRKTSLTTRKNTNPGKDVQ